MFHNVDYCKYRCRRGTIIDTSNIGVGYVGIFQFEDTYIHTHILKCVLNCSDLLTSGIQLIQQLYGTIAVVRDILSVYILYKHIHISKFT